MYFAFNKQWMPHPCCHIMMVHGAPPASWGGEDKRHGNNGEMEGNKGVHLQQWGGMLGDTH